MSSSRDSAVYGVRPRQWLGLVLVAEVDKVAFAALLEEREAYVA